MVILVIYCIVILIVAVISVTGFVVTARKYGGINLAQVILGLILMAIGCLGRLIISG